jgi:hypothetical protein
MPSERCFAIAWAPEAAQEAVAGDSSLSIDGATSLPENAVAKIPPHDSNWSGAGF